MKGLLLKDFYIIKRYCRMYFLFLAVVLFFFFVNDSLFLAFYSCMLFGMIPVTLLAYDEQWKWDEYCGTLPYTEEQIVSAKYLIGLFAEGFAVIVTGITQAVKMHISGTFTWNDYLLLLALILIVACVLPAISLPFVFRLGVQKGRIVFLGVFTTSSVAVGIGSAYSEDAYAAVSFGGSYLIMFMLIFALYALSWYLSIIFYKKRKF